jgi:hypothetical protein
MKMAVFWDVALCCLVDAADISEELTACSDVGGRKLL